MQVAAGKQPQGTTVPNQAGLQSAAAELVATFGLLRVTCLDLSPSSSGPSPAVQGHVLQLQRLARVRFHRSAHCPTLCIMHAMEARGPRLTVHKII